MSHQIFARGARRRGAVVALIAGLVVALVAAGAALGAFEFSTKWGGSGSAEGKFNQPVLVQGGRAESGRDHAGPAPAQFHESERWGR